jgi:hypothetical protein
MKGITIFESMMGAVKFHKVFAGDGKDEVLIQPTANRHARQGRHINNEEVDNESETDHTP